MLFPVFRREMLLFSSDVQGRSEQVMLSDIEIAENAKPKDIREVAAELGLRGRAGTLRQI